MSLTKEINIMTKREQINEIVATIRYDYIKRLYGVENIKSRKKLILGQEALFGWYLLGCKTFEDIEKKFKSRDEIFWLYGECVK